MARIGIMFETMVYESSCSQSAAGISCLAGKSMLKASELSEQRLTKFNSFRPAIVFIWLGISIHRLSVADLFSRAKALNPRSFGQKINSNGRLAWLIFRPGWVIAASGCKP